jgi:hypothetical protein
MREGSQMILDQNTFCSYRPSFFVFYMVSNYLLGLQVTVNKCINETFFRLFVTFSHLSNHGFGASKVGESLISRSRFAQKTMKTANEVLWSYLTELRCDGMGFTANVVQSEITFNAKGRVVK